MDGPGRGNGEGMAAGGGARAWQFLKRNSGFREAFAAWGGAASEFEDAPFPLRRESPPQSGAGRYGLYRLENPFAENGPASPFWRVAPMLDVEPARDDGPGLAALAAGAGVALAGLRLAGGALILKLERGGRARQLRIARGDGFDPGADNVEVRLRPGRDWPARYALSGELGRLLTGPAPRTGRGRGPGIANCCRRSTSRGPACRSPRSPRRCGARTRSRPAGMTRTPFATGSAGAWSARATSSTRAI